MQNQKNKFSKNIVDKYRLTEQLELVRRSISDIVNSQDQIIANHCNTITKGKMLRPIMLLLCARLAGSINDNHIKLAAVLELIHYASLVHDDVIDKDNTRRDAANLRSEEGNKFAVIFGDWLISRSFSTLLKVQDEQIKPAVIKAAEAMCEGELLQNTYAHSQSVTEEIYLKIISLKTAKLFECCCQVAAMLSCDNEKVITDCGQYGYNFGMAFQIINDIEDFENAGKDIINGQTTLPQIRFSSYGNKEKALNSCRQMSLFYLKKSCDAISCYDDKADGLIDLSNIFWD